MELWTVVRALGVRQPRSLLIVEPFRHTQQTSNLNPNAILMILLPGAIHPRQPEKIRSTLDKSLILTRKTGIISSSTLLYISLRRPTEKAAPLPKGKVQCLVHWSSHRSCHMNGLWSLWALP